MQMVMNIDPHKLRQLREDRAYSLRELAELSGLTENTIWRIEAGQRTRPYPSTVRKLAQALGVEPRELRSE